ncbi:aldehyde dehydrogenase family protein [uncultured Desulfosarcina sp.]|uniref:aldehyde dehydrogenase family protein n=1 Tax=uncultured Desulfosarcina sp. TaxID=218289 RepID=UPI0029C6ABE4|nr:aldehyde dehydrogenase family protein [uncultured Desulfosarcina sp.]
MTDLIPDFIPNWIDGEEKPSIRGDVIEKKNPANGKRVCNLARSNKKDVDEAVNSAKKAQAMWAATPAVQRGMLLHKLAMEMKAKRESIAQIVAIETGKSYKEALGETDGAISLAIFYASEGQRLYAKTTTSAVPNKYAVMVRQPVGVAGLIIAANTPIANVAWKVFPAMICGNSVVLKAAEDTPATAWIVGAIASDVGIPPGVLNIVQGLGHEAGAALVANPHVGVISFTGSTPVGRTIAETAGKRLAKVSLELGGKNPLLVCDDADQDNAVKWVLLSAFSNAGQRCASASRIIVFDAIYDEFKQRLVDETQKLKIGPADGDDLGPVINQKQLSNMLEIVESAKKRGAAIVVGGNRIDGEKYKDGYYMAPTLIENVDPDDEISVTELFGPIACLYRVIDFESSIALVNHSPYGLTASIHTQNFNRAWEFSQKVQSGVAVINAGTYGSEPHMPFGGLKQSGNGTREPGTEAIDIYSELKCIYINTDPEKV